MPVIKQATANKSSFQYKINCIEKINQILDWALLTSVQIGHLN